METLSKGVKPVRDLILRTNRGYGVYTGGHPQTVSMTQLLPFPPVEADPGRVPAVRRHRDLQLHPGRHHDRPEGEAVGADGGDHDGGHAGVDHAGAGRHRVGRAARGGGHDQSVSLH